MFSIANEQLETIIEYVDKITKANNISGVCLYGSRAAGYANSDSDYDILIVLNNYSHIIKYLYEKIQGIRISALIVDLLSIEKDAECAFLGEFVIGRLLHVYYPIINPQLFERLERIYKKRVIIEELTNISRSISILSSEISFPLEYVMFSKIRNRCSLHPNAVYSFLQTYAGNNASENIKIALKGYQLAFQDIIADGKPLLEVAANGNIIHLAGPQLYTNEINGRICLRLGKKLHELSSYVIHAYAGRKILHYIVGESRSKIKRQRNFSIEIPRFIKCPEDLYWSIPEGKLIFDGTNWLQKCAKHAGFEKYEIVAKQRLGSIHSGTWKYTISDPNTKNQKSIVIKHLTRSTLRQKGSLSWWNSQKIFGTSPVFSLGTEYKALRYLRTIGLKTPIVESVVPEKSLLVTEYLEGITMDVLAKNLLVGGNESSLYWLGIAGEEFAIVHGSGSTFGGLKPKDLIITGEQIYFTGLDRFKFRSGDPGLDILYLIACALGTTSNTDMAKKLARTFFEGYRKKIGSKGLQVLIKSEQHMESLYPVISHRIRQVIYNELRD